MIFLTTLQITVLILLNIISTIVVPELQQNLNVSLITGVSPHLTNNNCESLNHVIKHLINYKPQPVHILVKTLITHVKTQYEDLEKSLYGRGNYCLNSQFYNFRINYTTYLTKTTAERRSYFIKFLKFKVQQDDTEVCSSDGLLIMKKNPWAGKKPQPKEKRKKIDGRSLSFLFTG